MIIRYDNLQDMICHYRLEAWQKSDETRKRFLLIKTSGPDGEL